MHIESASTSATPIEDPTLGSFPVGLLVIEVAGMDGDATALQSALADLRKEVGKVTSGGSMTISATVVDGSKIVLMGLYRNPGIAYDETRAILAKHGVNTDEAPELTGNPYGDDRYQPGSRHALPPRVRTTVAAATSSAPAE